MPPPPVLMDELVEEVLLRLPPDDPASLFRASAVCKPWRIILAGPRFRRRYREFHGTPPILGLFQQGGRFVPASALVPAHPGLPSWVAMDCRHGRALFAHLGITLELVVLDPVTGHQHRVTSSYHYPVTVGAAVLCAAQGCDHHGCQGGHFHLAFVSTDQVGTISAWLYSSETAEWSKFTSLHHSNAHHSNALLQTFSEASVLVGEALYFNMGYIVECQLGTLRISMFKKPIDGKGCLMTAEDGTLGFAAVVDVANLTLWSMETGPEGATGWAKLKVIDLKALLPDGSFLIRAPEDGIWSITKVIPAPKAGIIGIAEGTQVIFVSTYAGSYMVDLKSRQVRKVSRPGKIIFPYMSFYLPAMEAASTGQGQ
ncbi:uncharacterized protein LOC119312319 [Triticum dicoccoides]|uniref:uncharacterized protein LOC119312319 n=1 Tax=Triticum dicoccoides TaxID=85692 RepID=UPI001891B69F|nr:uncharacterized protein LOC119312319 [Triticum dicoccoides]